MKYFKLIRIKHWLKNILIFLPLICSGLIFEKGNFAKTLIGFLSFSFMASSIYIINDINDVDMDRLHEKKKYRPIASGEITITKAKIISAIFIIVALIINLSIAPNNEYAWLCWIFYLIINILYSVVGCKKIPLLDIVILVCGFFIRVLYGSALLNINISAWLYLVIISGAFYLGFGKRRNELARNGSNTRDVLKKYSFEYLDKNLNSCMTLAITFYALWCIEKNNSSKGGYNFLITVPILMVIFFKYGLDLDGNSDGDPVDVILKDSILILLVLIFCGLIALMIYGG